MFLVNEINKNQFDTDDSNDTEAELAMNIKLKQIESNWLRDYTIPNNEIAAKNSSAKQSNPLEAILFAPQNAYNKYHPVVVVSFIFYLGSNVFLDFFDRGRYFVALDQTLP